MDTTQHPQTQRPHPMQEAASNDTVENSDEPLLLSLDEGAATAELAVWVILGLTFVGSLFAIVGPLAGRLAERISGLLP